MKPDDIKASKTVKERAFLIMVFYEGPWDRLACFCLGLYQDNRDKTRWDIGDNPTGVKKLLSALAAYCETRDIIWRYRYAIRKTNPHQRWRRGADTSGVQDSPGGGEAHGTATGGGVPVRGCRLDFPEQTNSSDH